MRNLIALITVLATCSMAQAATKKPVRQAHDRPNVLMIIVDDQGYGEFGFTGNRNVRTPNMDKLAKQSAFFSNFIVAPACSPTRSSLMMGRNHFKTGVWGVGPACNILDDEVFMPEFFKKAGYATALFGKGDSVQRREQRPWNLGVDDSSVVWGYDHKDPRMFVYQIGEDGPKHGVVAKKGYTCDISVDNTIRFIRNHKGKPWWCDLSFIIPHAPWEAAPEYKKMYKDKGYSDILSECWGSITQMDASIGRLMKALKEMGEDKNTIVVLFSDNGPAKWKNLTQKDRDLRNPQGLRGAKATIFENGYRVPLLVRWPGRIPAGERKQFASVEDILPTLLDFTGIDHKIIPEHLPFDGISIKSCILNPKAPETDRQIFRMEFIGGGLRRIGNRGGMKERWVINDASKVPIRECQVTLRGPRFKLYQNQRGKRYLYDMIDDPQESKDVSKAHPEIFKNCEAELEQQFREIMTSGRACRMPIHPVGANKPRQNAFAGIEAKRLIGDLACDPRKRSIKGFETAGTAATYAIKVLEDGDYQLHLEGTNLKSAKGLYVRIGDQNLAISSTTDQRVILKPIAMAKGAKTITVGVSQSSNAKGKTRAALRALRFSKRPQSK